MRKSKTSSGFTLIELLIVIAIVGILTIVVVITTNIPELLKQSRDSSRFTDMKTLSGAVSLYLNELPNGNIGSSSIIYVSLPDKTLSGNQTSTCTSLGLPTPPTGYNYQCSSPQSYRHVDGTGWVPVNLAQLASGAPFPALPIDPLNQSSTLYYTYTASGPSYLFTAWPESQKQKQVLGKTLQIPNYPGVIAQGSDATINPLFSTTGLVGYWPLDEGTGTVANDASGNSNTGAATGNLPYYAPGKVGPYAGNFDGSTDYVNITNNNLQNVPSGDWTVSVWANIQVFYHDAGLVIFNDAGLVESLGKIAILQSDNVAADSNSFPALNTWTHIAIVKSGGTYNIYFNGAVNNGSLSSDTGWGLGNQYYIGRGYSNKKFTGFIDDVRIYSRALSAAEIQALYNAGK
jgi:prepilin-type N-terminal cleavage/methylation domain-containing protein